MSKAVVLLSGGLDSSTTLAVADNEHDDIFAITFRYGQKHDKEIRSSKKLAEHYDVEKHIILDIPLEEIARSSLLEGGEEIPDTKKGDIGQ
ncbi:MAG: 7-cyano-7-deazaguanine synthase, partial [Candidatus Saliniplasma sp.]